MRRFLFLLAVLPGLAFSQSAPSPSFELADVHASPAAVASYLRVSFGRDGLNQLRQATMLDLIRIAWSMDPIRVVGGPAWLEDDHFDVIAKVPEGTPNRATMLQGLLADRFVLKHMRIIAPWLRSR